MQLASYNLGFGIIEKDFKNRIMFVSIPLVMRAVEAVSVDLSAVRQIKVKRTLFPFQKTPPHGV